MSISSTLSSALSGLTASARAADIVSSNLANAMTEGYAVRRLDLAARQTGNDGAGVRIVGVTRQEDTILIGQRRLATADLGANQANADFMTRLEAMLGAPDDPGSLSARLADFEGKLIAAANAPWNTTNLTGAVQGASAIADTLNELSSGIQTERKRADASIGIAVDQINGALESLAELNARILSVGYSGGDTAALVDAQNQLVDQVAPYVPLQTRRDNNGLLNVYSDDGHVLVNYRAAELGFVAKPTMDPYQSIGNGTLSGLTLDGRALRMDGEYPAFAGGQLRALFDVRDSQAPEAQTRLDGIALDLAERFDAAGLDPSIAAGSPSLFTDAGILVDGSNELGLASRIRVNAAVVPNEGGAVWRLRDGLGAAVEGPTGNATFLTAQIERLSTTQTTTSTAFSGAQRSMSELISENLSIVGLGRVTAETNLSSASAQNTALKTAELAGGVDSDAELQRLLQIEQMYAANARVINVAGQMMDELLRIAG
ncbi:flagellar hook-associated protein FlgK [Jannaschia sp. CCS1]|uniref:flagellar hook-associated protein FlgK n=1 Tax=Jannaschia sp. (strain CCS1) TaxID=290400 RepID=UPI000053CBE7|nr:flagellar hook-associated protein FlgK [Jannaschia sp. CCS1]ABD57091.1 flagellar hook-associated protein FlgK putative [Jannaschia sp. CCS1]